MPRFWNSDRKGKSGETLEDTSKVTIEEGTLAEINNILKNFREQGEYTFGDIADSLPVLPGLEIDGVGPISLPLAAFQAKEIIQVAERSPYGKEFQTLVDDSVRKSWQLKPEFVRFTNPDWKVGLDALMKKVKDRLALNDIPLRCSLYKMLLYEEGGHFLKHRDTEKEDGMFATMVIQFPSNHEGGDLVVYRNGKEENVHDFGKSSGKIKYSHHYAVHYADAEHQLRAVTKGYRLALVYSICWPKDMINFRQLDDGSAMEKLKDLFTKLDTHFFMFFNHEYTASALTQRGIDALKGIDRDRFTLMNSANKKANEKLVMHIVKVALENDYYDVSGSQCHDDCEWESNRSVQNVRDWRSMDGRLISEKWKTVSFSDNMLNPDDATLSQLWGTGNVTYEGYLGNESATKSTKYERYALVAWPQDQSFEYFTEFIGTQYAITWSLMKDPERLHETLQALIKMEKEENNDPSIRFYNLGSKRESLELSLFEKICEALTKKKDIELVRLFFFDIVKTLKFHESEIFRVVDAIIELVVCFSVEVMLPIVSVVLKDSTQKYLHLRCLIAREKSFSSLAITFLSHETVETLLQQDVLLKLVLHSTFRMVDSVQFDRFLEIIKNISPQNLSKILADARDLNSDATKDPNKWEALCSLARKRLSYCASHINNLKRLSEGKSWEMPYATYSGNMNVQNFLRSAASSFTLYGFSGIRHARNHAFKYENQFSNASFTMYANGIGQNAHIVFTKTRKYFEGLGTKIKALEEESNKLKKVFKITVECDDPIPVAPSSATSKRPRSPSPDVIILD
ncbi:hypothetical protein ROZALSC1DRAFT_30108 [Rozella allomycis CSF55]|uniref:Fe2OG dioxygenase domain-containing protein n=1 Tax=Rozella allomycis (strain CSF55) TaxID=988480 RepID=A0A4P9YHI7_ROZAC|nr:hypothetical protein ROZALSC1DRAFT_30108 [Rozella allomycis CSF55]